MLRKLPAQSNLSLRNITLAAGLSVLGIGTVFALSRKALQSVSTESPASLRASSPQQTKVLALGRLEPEGKILKIAGLMGAKIQTLKMEEGEIAKSGQILAYLDTYPEMLARRNLAASQVKELQNRLKSETALNEVEVSLAQSQMRQVDAPKSQELQSQESSIRQSQAALQQAIVIRDRYDRLHREGAVSQEDLELKKLLVVQIQEKLNQDKIKLNQLLAVRGADTQTAKKTIERSQANLLQVNSRSRLDSAIQNLKLADAQLEQTIIRAPRTGQILKIIAHPGEAITDRGILELGNTQRMNAVAEVYETDIRRVKVGQRATIASAALPESITGTVAQIGQTVFKNNIVGDDPSARSDARVVEVKVRLDQSQRIFGLSNLQVDVQIDLNSSQ
jgi:HlyD family secretion protein